MRECTEKRWQQMCKRSEKQNTFFWFMGLMGKRLPIYLLAILISSVGLAGSKVANSYLVKSIVTAAQTRQTEGLLVMVLLSFLAFVASQLCWRLGIMRYNIEGKRAIAKVEKQVFSKAMRLPIAYYEQNHSGDFMSKLIFDTERAGDIYGSRLRRLLAAIISAVVYLVPMFCFSWQLTLCLLVISLCSFMVNMQFTNPMKRAGSKLSAQNGVMTEKLTNMLAGMETTKIFPAGRKLLRDYDTANETCYKTQVQTNRMSAALESLNCLFDLTGSLAFLGLGIWFVSNGLIDLGELTAVYTLYGSFRYVFLDIGRYLPQMMNCIANAENVRQFLCREEEPERYERKQPAEVESQQGCTIKEQREKFALCVEHLTFSYNKERKILDDFSMEVEKGSCVAITGVSGKGKSTLAKLLLGFYAPDSGSLRIFGKSYDTLSLREVRQQIGYVPQEPYLYEVSIAENIAYGKAVSLEEVSMEEIIAAAKAANAHEFIMKLPKGYDTIPGERGNQLSGGEKQRIAIARAIIKNAPILLLDEATSALDNESERLVNEALDRLCRGRTTIMIAHRQSTIAMADRVICFNES